VGELFYKATIGGGGKGIFCDIWKFFLSADYQCFLLKRALEAVSSGATYSHPGGPRGLYLSDFAADVAREARN